MQGVWVWGDVRSWRPGYLSGPESQTKCRPQRHFLFQDRRGPGSYEKREEACPVCALALAGSKASVNLRPVDEIGLGQGCQTGGLPPRYFFVADDALK